MLREEVADHLKTKEDKAKEVRREQARQAYGVGVVMSELTADPRWQLYGEHLEAIKRRYIQQAAGYKQGLLGREYLSPERYGQMKLSLAESENIVKGIDIALGLAKVLIERGEQAAGVYKDKELDQENA